MIRKILLIFSVMSILFLSGCKSGRDISTEYPRLEYRNSSYNLDSYNREIAVDDGFVLDEGHSYDIVETEEGYDIVLHFVEKEGADNG